MRMNRMWKAFSLLFAVAATLLLASTFFETFINGEASNVTSATKKVSMTELRLLSLGPKMQAVVSRVVGSADGHSRKRVQERVDQVTISDLRAIAVAEVTSGKKIRTSDKLAEFMTTEDPAATCATAATAGWGGVDACTSQCVNRRYSQRTASHEGACVVLCELAVDPCTKELARKSSSWSSRAMKGMGKTVALLLWGPRLVMHHQRNDDMGGLLLGLLSLLLALDVAWHYLCLLWLRSQARQKDNDLVSTIRRTGYIKFNRVFRCRPKRGREYSLYSRNGVSSAAYWAIANAKSNAASRREGEAEAAAAGAKEAAAAVAMVVREGPKT